MSDDKKRYDHPHEHAHRAGVKTMRDPLPEEITRRAARVRAERKDVKRKDVIGPECVDFGTRIYRVLQ